MIIILFEINVIINVMLYKSIMKTLRIIFSDMCVKKFYIQASDIENLIDKH